MATAAREAAQATGMLPHEILLDIARGNPQTLLVPETLADGTTVINKQLVGVTMEERKDAAKAAAPYYAPRISAMEVTKGIDDDELDRLIAEFATQAGATGLVGGEGEEDEEEAGAGGSTQADRASTRRRVDL